MEDMIALVLRRSFQSWCMNLKYCIFSSYASASASASFVAHIRLTSSSWYEL